MNWEEKEKKILVVVEQAVMQSYIFTFSGQTKRKVASSGFSAKRTGLNFCIYSTPPSSGPT